MDKLTKAPNSSFLKAAMLLHSWKDIFRRISRPASALLAILVVTICGAPALANPGHEPYSWSYRADDSSLTPGACQIMNLTAHEGMLFAGIGYWGDNQSFAGPQVLMLGGPHAAWQLDAAFDAKLPNGIAAYRRVTALTEVSLNFDGQGRAVRPMTLLLAGVDTNTLPGTQQQLHEDLAVFTRDDNTRRWIKTTLPFKGRGIRAIGSNHDVVTGADYVWLATYDNGFIGGTYCPTCAGKISWQTISTAANPAVGDRIMSFATDGQKFYASAKPYMYEFQGGRPNYPWQGVASYPSDNNKMTSGVRGFIPIGGNTLMGVVEGTGYNSKVLDFFPYAVELNISSFLKEKTGSDFIPAGQAIDTDITGAYNKITQVRDPFNGSPRFVFGLGMCSGRTCPIPGKKNDAWFLSRDLRGTWNLHDVPSLGFQNPFPCPPEITDITVSPFPDDCGEVVYMGFADNGFTACRNTAHIFRVGLATALRPFCGR